MSCQLPLHALTPGMRVPWLQGAATVLAVDTNPRGKWTKVTVRIDSGCVTHWVDWSDSEQIVLPGFDLEAVEELAGYARRAGNHDAVAELQALIAANAA